MAAFKIDATNQDENTTLMAIGFGEPAENDEIARAAFARLKELSLGGKLLKIDGRASLQAISVIIHGVSHLFGAVAVNDPKLKKFIVVVSHSPDYKVGDRVD
jgi:CRISPR-associated protein Csx3